MAYIIDKQLIANHYLMNILQCKVVITLRVQYKERKAHASISQVSDSIYLGVSRLY